MKKTSKKGSYTLNFLRSCFAIFIILYLVKKYLFAEVISSISSSNLSLISVACGFSFIFHIIVSYRLKFLVDLQGISISILQVFKINLIATFYGLFLPAKNLTGGAIRFYELSKGNNKRTEALAAIFVDRVFATISLCTIGIIFWLIDRPSGNEKDGVALIIISAILFTLTMAISNVRF